MFPVPPETLPIFLTRNEKTMKNYEFTTSPAATEVIDELAKQIGVDAGGVIRHGLVLAAQQFRRNDLVLKLGPPDCVGLSNVSGQDAEPPKSQQASTGDASKQTQSADKTKGRKKN